MRQHIDQVPEKASQLPPKERTQRLNAALDAMGDGFNQVQLDKMTAAMTEEYIEAWDESAVLGIRPSAETDAVLMGDMALLLP